MTMQEIKDKFSQVDHFYGFQYGYREDNPRRIIKIRTEEVSKSDVGIRFIWGWPGPDYNTYLWSDYGETWAYTKEELIH